MELLKSKMKKEILKQLFTTLFVFLYAFLFSQVDSKNITYSNQQWLQCYNRLKLSEKYTLVSDGSFRWKNELKDYSLALLRTGISYNFYENNSAAIGIASTLSYSADKMSKMELRGWQEFILNQAIARLNISNRIRLEERYFKNIANNEFSSGYNFNYRFRYRFFISIPLNNNIIKERTISVNIGDEIFINFGKEIIYNLFDNNRIIAGLSYQLNKKTSVSLNYTNQFTQTKKVNSFEENDIFWLSLTHNTSFNKKGKEIKS